jgi:hypothetical protein
MAMLTEDLKLLVCHSFLPQVAANLKKKIFDLS